MARRRAVGERFRSLRSVDDPRHRIRPRFGLRVGVSVPVVLDRRGVDVLRGIGIIPRDGRVHDLNVRRVARAGESRGRCAIAGPVPHGFAPSVAEGVNVAVNVAVTAAGAGVRGIALFRTGRIGDNRDIVMAERCNLGISQRDLICALGVAEELVVVLTHPIRAVAGFRAGRVFRLNRRVDSCRLGECRRVRRVGGHSRNLRRPAAKRVGVLRVGGLGRSLAAVDGRRALADCLRGFRAVHNPCDGTLGDDGKIVAVFFICAVERGTNSGVIGSNPIAVIVN